MQVNPLDVPDVTEPYQPRSGQRGTGFLTDPLRLGATPSATVGPYLAIGLTCCLLYTSDAADEL